VLCQDEEAQLDGEPLDTATELGDLAELGRLATLAEFRNTELCAELNDREALESVTFERADDEMLFNEDDFGIDTDELLINEEELTEDELDRTLLTEEVAPPHTAPVIVGFTAGAFLTPLSPCIPNSTVCPGLT
jgi:hypothetical protein